MISLYVSDGQAFVWNADDWLKIRKEHRIIGELIGTIASKPRQDNYLGFPMALLPEEAALLVEEGISKLVEYTDFRKSPNTSLQSLVKETEDRLFAEQTDCMKEKRVEQMSLRIDMIVSGKQKKSARSGKVTECCKDTLLQEEIQKLPPLSIGNSLIQIATEHPWPNETKEVSINQLIPSVTSEIGRIRFAVFRDLWKKGYFITAGMKFGGDFLVYLGDPVKFHAMFIIKCLKNSTENMKLSNIVAFGRLGVSVNKLTVIAYLDDNDDVIYQTLQWHETLC